MPSKRLRTALAIAGSLSLLGVAFVVRSRRHVDAGDAPRAMTVQSSGSAVASSSAASVTAAPITTTVAGTAVRTLAWGRGAGEIGLPHEDEAHGETTLRLAAGSDRVVLLDAENDRAVHVGLDGGLGRDVRVPRDARDVALTKDGTLAVLAAEKDDGTVTLLGPDGATRARLPVPPDVAARSRSVLVSGSDVYVETMNGDLTRIGGLDGSRETDAGVAPGRPMRDGRGWLTARIANPESGAVHVYVVERGSLAQRWSRQVTAHVFVEGIFLVDTSAAGTIYLGVTGNVPGAADDATSAELLCLEPEHGTVVGAIDLGVRVGPEAILDAKALDDGGIVYSVFTKDGVRVERRDCR